MSSHPLYLAGMVRSPAKTMIRLQNDPRRARRAFVALASTLALYAISSAILGISGAVPLAPVVFEGGADNYYFWQMILALPCGVAVWFLAAGLVRFIGKGKKRGGTWKGALACTGLALAPPLVLAWLPSGVWALFTLFGMDQEEWVEILSLPGIWQSLYILAYVAAGVWAVALLILGSAASQKSGALRAAGAGIAAALVVTGTYILFVR